MRPQILFFVLLLSFGLGHANGESDETCKILAKNLKQDELMLGSSQEKFHEVQRLISEQSFRSWDTASHDTLGLGISVPKYVDLALNTTSNSTSWEDNWKTFKDLNYNLAANKESLAISSKTISVKALEIIADCAKTTAQARNEGLSAVLENVSPERDMFVIKIIHLTTGGSKWSFKGMDVTSSPQVPNAVVCPGFESYRNASLDNPKEADGSLDINCNKLSNVRVTISFNNGAGQLPSFSIPPVKDHFAEIDARLQALKVSVVPPGTIGFFELQTCPTGWQPAEKMRGRYAVGVSMGDSIGKGKGTALDNLEDRPTGAHEHSVGATGDKREAGFQGGGDLNLAYSTTLTSGIKVEGKDYTAKPGTNAPYVQLLACKKE